MEKLLDKINKGIIARREKEPARDYLGASSAGKACVRQWQFSLLNVPKDKPFTAEKLRIFDVGNMYEELAIKWIREAGIRLDTHDKDGKQFGFEYKDANFKGHIDGIIYYIGKRLWECKSMNQSSFKELIRKGIKESHFSYFIQAQIYMKNMGLTEYPAILTAVNKNNGDIVNIEIAFDSFYADKYINRALHALKDIEHGNILERESPSETMEKCRMCAWNKKCWDRKNERIFEK